jgi:hypothetical protein
MVLEFWGHQGDSGKNNFKVPLGEFPWQCQMAKKAHLGAKMGQKWSKLA